MLGCIPGWPALFSREKEKEWMGWSRGEEGEGEKVCVYVFERQMDKQTDTGRDGMVGFPGSIAYRKQKGHEPSPSPLSLLGVDGC